MFCFGSGFSVLGLGTAYSVAVGIPVLWVVSAVFWCSFHAAFCQNRRNNAASVTIVCVVQPVFDWPHAGVSSKSEILQARLCHSLVLRRVISNHTDHTRLLIFTDYIIRDGFSNQSKGCHCSWCLDGLWVKLWYQLMSKWVSFGPSRTHLQLPWLARARGSMHIIHIMNIIYSIHILYFII